MAEKIILRPEPYDPDAIDADGDGIVQERTPWERPAGTRLLDKFGDAITAGRSLTERPEGLQVVDDKGKPVRYIPSYGGGEAPAPTGKATPLADHGARSLREMGLPSIQSMTAPPPPQAAPDTIPKPVSRTKPVPVPEAPKRPRQPSPPPLSGRAQELADRAGGDWRKFAELLDQEGFVVFDYETTGFDNGNIPVQVGAVKIQNGKIVGRMNVYMNPERGLSGWSKDNLKDANGNPLTDEFLREQPSLADAHQQLAEFIDGGIIVAHNLPFDQEVIDRTMAEQGIPFTHAGGIDTLELARQILPKGDGGPESHALGPLTDHLGIPLEGWHTADADSAATGKVLGAILQNAVAKNADKKLLSGSHQKQLHASAIEQYKKELDAYKKAKEEYDRAFQRGEDVLPPVPTPPEQPLSEEARQLLAPPRELPDLPKSITRPTSDQIEKLTEAQRTDFDDFAEAVQEAIDSEGLSDEHRKAIATVALNSFYWATNLADSSGTLTSSLNTLVGGILDADGAEGLHDLFRWGGTAALAMPLLSMREKFDWSKQQMNYVAGRISESFKASKIKAGELSSAFKAKMASTFDKIMANYRAKRNPKIAKAAEIADVLDGVNVPKVNPLDVNIREIDDSTPEGILAKNEAILAKIEAGGSQFGELSAESKDKFEKPRTYKHVFHPRTPEEQTAARVESMKWWLEGVRQGLGLPPAREGFIFRGPNADLIQSQLAQLHPDIREYLKTASDDEIISRVTEIAVRYHSGIDKRVHISIPATERLDAFLTDGHYKTTHEVPSDHSGPAIRAGYEATLGIDPAASLDVRPASGWIAHSEWLSPDGTPDMKQSGSPDMYGPVRVTLKPEVNQRVKYTRGDSLNGQGVVIGLDETDPEKIANALVHGDNKLEDTTVTQIFSLLEADRTGSFARVNNSDGFNPNGAGSEGNTAEVTGEYLEALIPGAFSTSEVDEMAMDWSHMTRFAMRGTDRAALFDEMESLVTTEKLQSLGFSESEISAFRSWIADARSSGFFAGQELLQQVVEFRAVSREKERIEKLGIKLNVTGRGNNGGVFNRFDPTRYGGNPGDDIEKILLGNLDKRLLKMVQDQIELNERAKRFREQEGEVEVRA